ncbi:MAG: hypothetical protein M1829_005312 [Trizodia sp. TS-e1964]|nr:MAG: hypothetical protein M1829_005312 [Trizodia sp. TS-e1964]
MPNLKPHAASLSLRRPSAARPFSSSSALAARLIKRPHRPYTFAQLITLSDGSTFTHRTTSPLPIYKATKDTRNHPLWNPSSLKLANQEEDDAGRLRAFRERFGRGWDAEGTEREDGVEAMEDNDESLMDLISGHTGGGAEALNAKTAPSTPK